MRIGENPCPKCGAQIMDPFGMGRVIHDVARCDPRALWEKFGEEMREAPSVPPVVKS